MYWNLYMAIWTWWQIHHNRTSTIWGLTINSLHRRCMVKASTKMKFKNSLTFARFSLTFLVKIHWPTYNEHNGIGRVRCLVLCVKIDISDGSQSDGPVCLRLPYYWTKYITVWIHEVGTCRRRSLQLLLPPASWSVTTHTYSSNRSKLPIVFVPF